MSRFSIKKSKDDRPSPPTTPPSSTHGRSTTSINDSTTYGDASPMSSPQSSEAMLVEGVDPLEAKRLETRRFKIASVILFFCILSFVLQTELTKVVQTSMGYHKPYFILYICHSFWAITLPLQFLYTVYVAKARPRSLKTFRGRLDYFVRIIQQSTNDLQQRKGSSVDLAVPRPQPLSLVSFSTPEKKALLKHLFWVTLFMTILFMVPSYMWYVCIAMTTMANLTAIYNTSCFFAYVLSIMFLKERLVAGKVVAVLLSLAGVVVIALTTQGESDDDRTSKGSLKIVGDILALVCAAFYGFEEVMYKKYASPKVWPVTFANALTGLMGFMTLLFLWIPIPILHFSGHETFELPAKDQILSIVLIAVMGLIYNGCFMIVVSMTSPVFAAVGVMATIPVVAVVDWLIFHVSIGWGNIVGGLCILVGFAILVHENRKALKTVH